MSREEALKELQKRPEYNNYPDGPPANADTTQIRQPDNTKIKIIGFGGMFIHYTETLDGYTILINDQGIYEYAIRAAKGDLKASGMEAKDPDDRDKSDESFLKNIPKHLRYEGDKLGQLIVKQYKWNESVYYGQQYREYKKQKEKEKAEEQKNLQKK